MKRFTSILFISLFLFATFSCSLFFQKQEITEPKVEITLAQKVFYTTCRIVVSREGADKRGIGSGITLECRELTKGYQLTVLTAAHVLPTNYEQCRITLQYWDNPKSIVITAFPAVVQAIDREKDLALITTFVTLPRPVAKLASLETMSRIKLMDKVHQVGCRLGQRPSIGEGIISHMYKKDKWGASVSVIFGCSGGAIFSEIGECIGILTQVSAFRTPFGGTPVCHMAIFVNGFVIQEFLEETDFYNIII